MPKLCKVWNHDRTVRKSVVAKSFEEMVRKGKEKLGVSASGPVTVVLDLDGTEVLDEEYFNTLPEGTRFLLLRQKDHWVVDRIRNYPDGDDVTDSAKATPLAPHDIQVVLTMLRQDITKIVTLNREELQVLVSLDQTHLSHFLHVPLSEAIRIQNNSQRYLDEMQDSQEAMELIRLLKDAKDTATCTSSANSLQYDSPDGASQTGIGRRQKRKRTDMEKR